MASRRRRLAKREQFRSQVRTVEERIGDLEAAAAEDPKTAAMLAEDFAVMRHAVTRMEVEIGRVVNMRRFATHAVRRGPRPRGAGRPAHRRSSRATSRAGPSDDDGESEPGPSSGLLDRTFPEAQAPRVRGSCAFCCSNDPGRWSRPEKGRRR